MAQRPENSDPIREAGQISDPDQSANINGDQPAAGSEPNSTEPGPRTTGGNQLDSAPTRTSGGGDTVNTGAVRDDGVTVTSADRDRADHDEKLISETGFPNVPDEEVEAQNRREIDTESLAGTRKFQPREGDDNPNVSHAPTSGTGATTNGRGAGSDESDVDRLSPAARNDRDGDESEAESYGTPENTPRPAPVQHSRVVEERVQRQERDYDLNTTEDGERYITPTDLQ